MDNTKDTNEITPSLECKSTFSLDCDAQSQETSQSTLNLDTESEYSSWSQSTLNLDTESEYSSWSDSDSE